MFVFEIKADLMANICVLFGAGKNISIKNSILQAPEPTTRTELKAYLGMLNFYAKFLNNVSTITQPLYRLLRKEKKWSWMKEQRGKAHDITEALLEQQESAVFSQC